MLRSWGQKNNERESSKFLQRAVPSLPPEKRENFRISIFFFHTGLIVYPSFLLKTTKIKISEPGIAHASICFRERHLRPRKDQREAHTSSRYEALKALN